MAPAPSPPIRALSRLLENRFLINRHGLLTEDEDPEGEPPSGTLGDLQPGMRVLVTLDRQGRATGIGPPGKKVKPREGEVLGVIWSVDPANQRFTLRAEDSRAEETFAVAPGVSISPPWTAAQWKQRLDQLVQQAQHIKAGIQVPPARRVRGPWEPPPPMPPPTSRKDQKALQRAPGPDLSVGPQDDPNATPAAICPVGGFQRHSPILLDFAQQSKENWLFSQACGRSGAVSDFPEHAGEDLEP